MTYRTKEEEDQWRARDPLKQFRERVVPEGLIAAYELDRLDRDAEELMEEAIKFADESPMPEPGKLYEDVYVDYPVGHDAAGREYGGLGSLQEACPMNETKLHYLQEDVLHLVIAEGKEFNSVELFPNVTAEIGSEGQLIGIEILNARDYLRDSLLPPAQDKLRG